MARGIDTSQLIIENRVVKDIVAGCDKPEVMLAILAASREVAFRRMTVDAFNEFCAAQPCVLWTPEYPHLIDVRIRRKIETTPIRVTRIVWTITHVCSLQGEMLRGHEELHHDCGNNGHANSGQGACLNPAHMIKGGAEVRKELRKVRDIMQRRGLRQVTAV